MKYYHVDVFSQRPLTGNGLCVFLCDEFPESEKMLLITREMKQFESIFLKKNKCLDYDARIFTVDEELDFAGHPILGAAAVVSMAEEEKSEKCITFHLNRKDVFVESVSMKNDREYFCKMDQGVAEYINTPAEDEIDELIRPLHINRDDLLDDYPLEVCSTGLSYLIVPLKKGIEKGGIFTDDYEKRMEKINSKFVYLLQVENDGKSFLIEGRTWDHSGNEDVATGSAAGPAGNYLVRHNFYKKNEEIIINQGRFTGRASKLNVLMNSDDHMIVSGKVNILGIGDFYPD